MKKHFNIFSLAGTFSAAILCLSFVLLPQNNDIKKLPTTVHGDICYAKNDAFQDGEEIVYRLYYNLNFVWIPAGEVAFKVRDLGSQYHISADGRTVSSFEWFYKVSDRYDTYIDKSTLLPTSATKTLREGGYRLYDKLTFDQSARTAINLRGKTQAEAKPTELALDGCMHDLLSTLYYTRNIKFDGLQQGDRFPVRFLMDKRTYPLSVKYFGKRKSKKIKDLGTFNTIELSPQLVTGEVFKEGAEMRIWATDDANRLPLLIESPVSVGSVKAVLRSYKGLRHELSSKVK